MRSLSLFLSVLALATASFAAPILERLDVKKRAAPTAEINHRSVPMVETPVGDPTSVVTRAAPAVDIVIDNPNDVVT